MYRKLLITCVGICFLAAVPVRGDDADIKKAAKSKADECQSAFMKGEFAKFAEMTHPTLVEKMGGKEKMQAFLASEMKKMKEQGVGFKSVKTLDPGELFRVGKEIYIGIPITLEMTVPGGRLQSKSMLIGLSKDEGKTWTFVDANPLAGEKDKLKQIFPDLPATFVIPKPERPVFTKD